MMKKLVAILLCVLLAASLTAVAAFAADEGEETPACDAVLRGYQNKTNGYDVRIVAEISNLENYSEVGFVLSDGTKEVRRAASYVFRTLTASDDEGRTYEALTAEDGNYLYALTIENIAAEDALFLTVAPYTVSADGETTVVGTEKALLKSADGVFTKAVVPEVTVPEADGTPLATVAGLSRAYVGGAEVSFTVTAAEWYRVGEVTVNGTPVTPTDGVYTLTLEADQLQIAVTTVPEVYSGTNPANAGQQMNLRTGTSPTSVMLLNLKFTDLAAITTADNIWCVDVRLKASAPGSDFFALSMVWDGSHLYLSSRKASGVTFPDPTYVIGQLNTADGYNMVLVRDGAQLEVYAETAENQLMHLASFKTSLSEENPYYAIGYEANASVSDSLSKSEVETGRTRQISWVNYDGYTAADLERIVARELGEDTRVTEDERVTLGVSAGNSTVTFNPNINKDNLHSGDTLTFTVAPDDYATVTRVLFNGEEVTAADGVYTVTLTDGANTLTVETESRIYRGTHKVNGDEVRGVNAGSSAKSILFVNLKFTGLADILTEDNVWCIDLRLRTTSSSGGFFALSMVWDGTNLYLSNRKASGATFANPAYVIEKLNSDDGFDMALVRDGKQLKVYADGGDGALVPIASFTTSLDAEGALYAIGYEANKPSITGCLAKDTVESNRTRQISWANYDGFTEAELAEAVAHRYNGRYTLTAEQ